MASQHTRVAASQDSYDDAGRFDLPPMSPNCIEPAVHSSTQALQMMNSDAVQSVRVILPAV
jgi:hypothetical protein